MDSPFSRSDSSSEPGEGSESDLMSPPPLSCIYAAPPLVGLASSVGEDELVEWWNSYWLPSSVILRVPTPEERDMSGGVTNDPFAAYQEAAKVMSAKKGSSSRSASGDEVMITGSHRSTVVKLEPSPSLPGKRPKSGGMTTRSAQQSVDMARSAGSLAVAFSNRNLNVFPQDGTVLPIGDPSQVVQVLQGGLLWTVSQLYHIGERLSSEDLPTLREEIEDLKRQVSGERDQRVAPELEVRDLKDKRLGIARDDQEVPSMIRKTCQVMRFWRQIEAREEGW
ncbi:hypothetical protein Bca52824_065166 [Brassica carinata]|uniref:Uncharacterized protein n=1 Tax=Brassica carinata TaxID=52824 RepID=A0A8X7QHQ8_BRACI|nr:hypothetical protein Bca52824_065166 [Brassica carinata]